MTIFAHGEYSSRVESWPACARHAQVDKIRDDIVMNNMAVRKQHSHTNKQTHTQTSSVPPCSHLVVGLCRYMGCVLHGTSSSVFGVAFVLYSKVAAVRCRTRRTLPSSAVLAALSSALTLCDGAAVVVFSPRPSPILASCKSTIRSSSSRSATEKAIRSSTTRSARSRYTAVGRRTTVPR